MIGEKYKQKDLKEILFSFLEPERENDFFDVKFVFGNMKIQFGGEDKKLDLI